MENKNLNLNNNNMEVLGMKQEIINLQNKKGNLTKEEELFLVDLAKNNDIYKDMAFEALAIKLEGLIKSFVASHKNVSFYFDDLMQVGRDALSKSIVLFDMNKTGKNKFSTYAYTRIKEDIQKEADRLSPIKVEDRTKNMAKKMVKALNEYDNSLSDEELEDILLSEYFTAEEIKIYNNGLSIELLRCALRAMSNTLDLDSPIKADSSRYFIDLQEDKSVDPFKEQLKLVFNKLSKKEVEILCHLTGAFGKKELKKSEICSIFNVTYKDIDLIMAKAFTVAKSEGVSLAN